MLAESAKEHRPKENVVSNNTLNIIDLIAEEITQTDEVHGFINSIFNSAIEKMKVNSKAIDFESDDFVDTIVQDLCFAHVDFATKGLVPPILVHLFTALRKANGKATPGRIFSEYFIPKYIQLYLRWLDSNQARQNMNFEKLDTQIEHIKFADKIRDCLTNLFVHESSLEQPKSLLYGALHSKSKWLANRFFFTSLHFRFNFFK